MNGWLREAQLGHRSHNGDSWGLGRTHEPQRTLRNSPNEDLRPPSVYSWIFFLKKTDIDNNINVLNLKLYPQLNFGIIIYTRLSRLLRRVAQP